MKTLTEVYDDMLEERVEGLTKWVHHLELYEAYINRFIKAHSFDENNKLTIINFSCSEAASALFTRYLDQKKVANKVYHCPVNTKDDAEIVKALRLNPGASIAISDSYFSSSQQNMVKFVLPKLPKESLLFIENTQYSTRKEFNDTRPSFQEWFYVQVGQLNGWYSNQMQDKQFELKWPNRDDDTYQSVTPFAKSVSQVHQTSGMIIIEKSEFMPPWKKTKYWS